MRQSAKCSERALDIFRCDAKRERCGGSRHRIGNIMPPAQAKSCETDSSARRGTEIKIENDRVRRLVEPNRRPVTAALMSEADHARAYAIGELPDVGIVAIQNRIVGSILVFEQPRLRASIVFEIFIAVEVIVAEIEMHTCVWPEVFDPFELETRHLDDCDVPFAANCIDQRRAEIAAHESAASRCLQNLAEQHDHRALAVGAGDRSDWHFEQATRELDFSNYRDSFLDGSTQQK